MDKTIVQQAKERLAIMLKGIKEVNGIGISRGGKGLEVRLTQAVRGPAQLPTDVMGFTVHYQITGPIHKR